jgi:hypothetical protein
LRTREGRLTRGFFVATLLVATGSVCGLGSAARTATPGMGGVTDSAVTATRIPTATAPLSPSERAAQDDSPDLPGTFIPSQGRSHFPGGFAGHVMTPFCDGVPHSSASLSTTAVPTADLQVTTPVSPPFVPAAAPPGCYSSNPPSSGRHMNVQRAVDIGVAEPSTSHPILPSTPMTSRSHAMRSPTSSNTPASSSAGTAYPATLSVACAWSESKTSSTTAS